MVQDGLVSIIVPVYNAGAYIEETIRMVEAQTYSEWELILVDDCSKDNSRAVIEAYLEKRDAKRKVTSVSEGNEEDYKKKGGEIRLIVKEVNQGAAMARNTGMDAAVGRYIAF